MKKINKISDTEIDEIINGCIEGVYPTSHEVAMALELKNLRSVALYDRPGPSIPAVPDYFAGLVAEARVRADKAMRKFPQPNYVLNKVSEESGEVIKGVIHYIEGRETWENVEHELIDNLAMLIRLVIEGDHVIGFTPPAVCFDVMADISNGENHEKSSA